ncbi:nucleotidyltransferase [Evansella halocellulosilytica]|uniref:nucleotidyltransferase n=1 Tax=Evansella halocellulosilytica TaxID=2011013 RepID=UPI000BB746D2|nr:nucleotidyltransferase [Evansella halocellulosilytica]
MKSLGVVVEYNPFHNGHLYHLQASKKHTNADVTVAVMSGSFLQRGEPAIANKWSRTKMALKAGVDLIVELPYLYSAHKAEVFSDAAVALLHTLGIDELCFGSEEGNITRFINTVEHIHQHRDHIDSVIQTFIKEGNSYPAAFAKAFQQVCKADDTIDLSKPNNILGYHYVLSIKKLSSSITPATIKREKAGYHDIVPTDHKITSATAIRNQLLVENKDVKEVAPFLPVATTEELLNLIKNGEHFASWETLFPLLQYKLLTEDIHSLNRIYECTEGIEYRLKKMITKADSFYQFVDLVKTKRYTWTRIQRLLVHLIMNTSKQFMDEHSNPLQPTYIRILGMSSKGQHYLSAKKKSLNIPLITTASQGKHLPVLQKEIQAAQLRNLPIIGSDAFMNEYNQRPIRYNEEKGTFH